MNGKLELTWIESSRQWRKRRSIGGKRKDFWLGTGKGRADRESYERAFKKWRLIEAELDANSAQRRLEDTISELELEQRASGSLEAKSAVLEQIRQLRQGATVEETDAQRKLRAEIRCAIARNDYAAVLEKTRQLSPTGTKRAFLRATSFGQSPNAFSNRNALRRATSRFSRRTASPCSRLT